MFVEYVIWVYVHFDGDVFHSNAHIKYFQYEFVVTSTDDDFDRKVLIFTIAMLVGIHQQLKEYELYSEWVVGGWNRT